MKKLKVTRKKVVVAVKQENGSIDLITTYLNSSKRPNVDLLKQEQPFTFENKELTIVDVVSQKFEVEISDELIEQLAREQYPELF